jgi:hypothetical protein
MSRFRQIYNIWGLWASEPPATGYCFSNYADQKHNNPELGLFDHNLLHQIDRIQNIGYSVSIDRTNLAQLGTRSLVGRPIVNHPNVELSLSYLIAGVRNEDRLGFVTNYQDFTGNLHLSQDTCCFQNFTGYDTDSRNVFIAISPDQSDLANRIQDVENPNGDINPSSLFVFGFGNCYLNSYRVNASVGSFPVASVGFICDNIMAYSSGSGVNIPAVLPKTGSLVPNVKFTIPRLTSIPSPSVIQPKDITLEITNLFNPVGTLYNEIFLFNKQTNLYNKIRVSGDYGNETLLINNGETIPPSGYFSGLYLKNTTSDLYNQLFTSGTDGNQVVLSYSGVSYQNSGFFDILYLKNITNNRYVGLNTFGDLNNENVLINNLEFTNYPTDALFGVNSSGVPIQSFDMSVNLDREDLKAMGYVLPIDRKVNFPIFANLNFSTIVGDNFSGSLIDKIQKNQSYDLIVNMYNPGCTPLLTRQIGIQYKIKNAKLENFNYNHDLNSNLTANFGFRAEIDISNEKGMFISGSFKSARYRPIFK